MCLVSDYRTRSLGGTICPPLLPVLLLMPPSEPPLQLEPQCYNMSSHTIGASATTCQCPPVVLVSGLQSVPLLLATMLKLVPLRLCTAESATICYCTALLPCNGGVAAAWQLKIKRDKHLWPAMLHGLFDERPTSMRQNIWIILTEF